MHARSEHSRETYNAHVITVLAQMTFATIDIQKMHILHMHSTWQCGADERACQPVDG
jgi:hypothetical protein